MDDPLVGQRGQKIRGAEAVHHQGLGSGATSKGKLKVADFSGSVQPPHGCFNAPPATIFVVLLFRLPAPLNLYPPALLFESETRNVKPVIAFFGLFSIFKSDPKFFDFCFFPRAAASAALRHALCAMRFFAPSPLPPASFLCSAPCAMRFALPPVSGNEKDTESGREGTLRGECRIGVSLSERFGG